MTLDTSADVRPSGAAPHSCVMAAQEAPPTWSKTFAAERMPPLGVVPGRIWREQRAAELARAIHQHIDGGFIGGGYYERIADWLGELQRLWRELPESKF